MTTDVRKAALDAWEQRKPVAGTPHRSLRDAGVAHGAEEFRFEVLERLGEEPMGLARDRLLKSRPAH